MLPHVRRAVLQLTADTSRTTIPAKALWASTHLTDNLTVQNALFPKGILNRKDIGSFAPPDNEVPLNSGHLSQLRRNRIGRKGWSGRPDLNRGPPAPKAGGALHLTALESIAHLKTRQLGWYSGCT
jgi:hypothetical protein